MGSIYLLLEALLYWLRLSFVHTAQTLLRDHYYPNFDLLSWLPFSAPNLPQIPSYLRRLFTSPGTIFFRLARMLTHTDDSTHFVVIYTP
ncbi:uncharacterized protein F5891DRAFT_68433 [Suillus fuscotomentosus]|uniref:Secreted protein n=1 Tax=Suillus fuscotomentosus TaxID=1912939 RepID=A0AAD4DSI3_9AGAM|nr:uncharacterized protein F5891DRAFT_68433 [Suillus fuscotomentosus]KAG1893026.1 hypothetical protein F5891DRAFT_68433 [Suillus fuscotomentosus]